MNYILQTNILDTVIDYINHKNLVSYKREDAITALSYISKYIHKDKINLLHEVLINIIKDEFTELKKRYYEEEPFFIKTPHDYKALKLNALTCLIQTGYKDYKYIFDNLNLILKDDLLESTYLPAVISLGKIGMELNSKKYLNHITNYLFHFANSSDNNIVAHSIFYLSKIIRKNEVSNLQTFLFILMKMKDDPDSSLRWSVAKSCINLKTKILKNPIINTLS